MSLRAFSRVLATVNKQLDETNTKAKEVVSAIEAAQIKHRSYKDQLAEEEPALAGYLDQLDNIARAWITTKDAFAKNQIGIELQKAFDLINRAGFEKHIDWKKWVADIEKTLETKTRSIVKNAPKGGGSSSSSSATSGGLVL